MTFMVKLSARAEADIDEIVDWIASQADVSVAIQYVARLSKRIFSLEDFPNRGSTRLDYGPGVLSLSFERRYLVLYRVEADAVTVLRVVASARDLSALSLT